MGILFLPECSIGETKIAGLVRLKLLEKPLAKSSGLDLLSPLQIDTPPIRRKLIVREILTAALTERKIEHMLEHKYYRYPSSEDKVGEWSERVLELMLYHDDLFY